MPTSWIMFGGDAGLLVDDGAQPLLADLALAVGQLLESVERSLEILVLEDDPQLGEGVSKRGAPRVLAEHEHRWHGRWPPDP